MRRQKRVIIHSNFCKAFTGFGKHSKNILRYLFDTGKYEIIELANGKMTRNLKNVPMPWKCLGSLPEDRAVLSQIASDPQAQRLANYGHYGIDQAIKEVKPDVYIGIEDIWGLDFTGKPWWEILTPMVWTTLDSLPILPQAFDVAKKTKNFFVWASFAEKAMKKTCPNVSTLHGSIDTDTFFPIEDQKRHELRASKGIAPDDFIIGFVFRNQLRKLVPNLLAGFAEFRKQNPEVNAKLLLHTHWAEGWDIPRLCKEKGVSPDLVLTTYYCPRCNQYEIMPFRGENLDCRCGAPKSQQTTNISQGVDELQLNEIYNLMDVYCHPFTSGGQEIPIQEAKLAGLVTLVTDYSCGEDHCTPDSGGLPLEWSEYTEIGTQFIKASTYPSSIAKQLKRAFNMGREKRKKLGKKARQFVLDNFAIESVGKKLESILDSLPLVDEKAWEKLEEIEKGELTISDFLDDDQGKRILVAMPESLSDVILLNSLMGDLKLNYPDYNIYFATNPMYFSAIDTHPAIHKLIPFHPFFENALEMEGTSEKEGLFEMVFLPHILTQRHPCYTHNGKDVVSFDL